MVTEASDSMPWNSNINFNAITDKYQSVYLSRKQEHL
jgi:hypothetical protein